MKSLNQKTVIYTKSDRSNQIVMLEDKEYRGEGGNMGQSFFSVCNSKTIIELKMGYEAIPYTNIISPHVCKVIT